MSSDWSGLPENPERSGWHWIATLPQLPPSPWRWLVDDGVGDWFAPGSRWCSPLGAVACHTYLGPCLTPADLAARVEAGATAMRERGKRACDGHADTLAENGVGASAIAVARTCAVIINTLPTDTPAYDAAIQAAYKQGWDDRENDFLAGAARIGAAAGGGE